jgi:RNA polymerase sigma-70 factor, ECF subfamily
MSSTGPSETQRRIEEIYLTESKRVFATLVRILRDFDIAEEAMHDAFATAVERWEVEGVPKNPCAWLVSAGRFKAIDALRRRGRFDASKNEISKRLEEIALVNVSRDSGEIEDDRLRLIFTCCHPAIDPKVQVPLTLREVCGLTTEEIASAYLTAPSTMAQRIVRGKAKIRDAGIPFVIPSEADFTERLESVLTVIYLVFNEGYSASNGASITKTELTGEAIRLGRLLVELLPVPEASGLLALMLLHESRHRVRTSPSGDIVLLENQDRSQWDAGMIAEGKRLVEQSLASRRFGAYTLQAAIALVHATAETANATDWPQIVTLYSALHAIHPSPVIELNRAVAVAMSEGPAAGLLLIDGILERGELREYHLAYAARADLNRRLGRVEDARAAYLEALRLAKQEPEIRFLKDRIASLPSPDSAET